MDIYDMQKYPLCSRFTTKTQEVTTYICYKCTLKIKTYAWNLCTQENAMWWKAISCTIYIYQALLIDENNEKPSHSLTISLKSRAISLFGEETGWNSMCLLKGELATTKLYAKDKKKSKREKEKEQENTKLKLVAWTRSWNKLSRCTLLLTHAHMLRFNSAIWIP